MGDAMTHHADDEIGGTRGPREDAGDAAERLTRLTHDLRGLLDGSLRWLSLLERGLPGGNASTAKQIDTVRVTLRRMAGLISEASGGRDAVDSLLAGTTWRQAIEHAAEALQPRAIDAGVKLRCVVEDDAGEDEIGALYSVILNGLSNAIESVERANLALRGTGEVIARLFISQIDDRPFTVLEIEDDGEGPPVEGDPRAVFTGGFSTRNPGRGVGLGLAGELVEQAGGTIELLEGPGQRPGRGGALLRVRVPCGASARDARGHSEDAA
ncbi:MAG: ATP-binding protein [Planctomycetota bacterium]